MFTFDQLRYFVETASQEHVGRASVALGVSPSTVSQSLANLEALLGQPLFLRAGKSIHLNSAGVAFLQRAQTLLGQAQSLRADFAQNEAEPIGTMRMATTYSLSGAMTTIWIGTSEKFPRMTGDLRIASSQEVMALVLERRVDFGLRFGLAKDLPQIEQVAVQDVTIVVCVRAGHPVLRHPESEQLMRLKSYPSAVPRTFQPRGDDAESPLTKIMRSPVADLVYDSYDAAMSFVTGTDAWTMMPNWVFEAHRDELREIDVAAAIRPKQRVVVTAIWRADSPQAGLREVLLQDTRDFFAKKR